MGTIWWKSRRDSWKVMTPQQPSSSWPSAAGIRMVWPSSELMIRSGLKFTLLRSMLYHHQLQLSLWPQLLLLWPLSLVVVGPVALQLLVAPTLILLVGHTIT